MLPLTQLMNATDLTIIYLACGSPFAVFQATHRQKNRSDVYWTRVFLAFFFWPVSAIALLAGKIFPSEARSKAEFHNRLKDLRFDIEQVAFAGESISSLFEFRETFYRFVGLSEAIDQVPSGKSKAEIFEITGHHNSSLASRCLARRNTAQLSFHRSTAREEFVELVSGLIATGSNRIGLASLVIELANHLADEKAADSFRAMASVAKAPDGEWTSGLEKDVWKSRWVRTGNDSDRGFQREYFSKSSVYDPGHYRSRF